MVSDMHWVVTVSDGSRVFSGQFESRTAASLLCKISDEKDIYCSCPVAYE